MRRVLPLLALVFELVPATANAQYGAGRVVPAVGVPNAGVVTAPNAGAGAVLNAGAGAAAGPVGTDVGALGAGGTAGAGAVLNAGAGAGAGAVLNAGAGAAAGAGPVGTDVGAGGSAGAGAVGGYGSAEQQSQAYYYLYQYLLYGSQPAGYATPNAQAQVARGVSDYFSNGAAATAVPTTGPAAAYFTNGGEATIAPTSVMPDYSFSPPLAPAASFTIDAGAPVRAEAPAEISVAPAASASAAGPSEGIPAEPAPTESPATAAVTGTPSPAPPAPAPAYAPPPAYAPAPAATSAPAPAPAYASAARVSPGVVVWPMVGGIAIGALLVLLGTRIRPHSRTV
jgi:hypothetical protein